jgi:hypothetical protein
MRFRLQATAALVAAVCLGVGIGWLVWGNESSEDEATALLPTPTPEATSEPPAPPTPTPEPGELISIAFGPQQIWNILNGTESGDRVTAIHQCAPVDVDWNDCIWQAMQQNGGSRDAFDFFKLTDGFLQDLEGEGTVKLGTIAYPWRANEIVQPILLGGDPPIVRVENPAVHPSVEDDPDYKRLERQHPDIWFWQTGPSLESASVEPDGGQSFIFRYRLLDGCHACEVLGYARVEYDFFPSGGLDIKSPRLLGVIEKDD